MEIWPLWSRSIELKISSTTWLETPPALAPAECELKLPLPLMAALPLLNPAPDENPAPD